MQNRTIGAPIPATSVPPARARNRQGGGEVGDNHGVVATGCNAFVLQVCRRIAGVTGANQAGLAVLERGGRICALGSGHEPEQCLLDDLPRQKDLDLVSGLAAPGGTT